MKHKPTTGVQHLAGAHASSGVPDSCPRARVSGQDRRAAGAQSVRAVGCSVCGADVPRCALCRFRGAR